MRETVKKPHAIGPSVFRAPHVEVGDAVHFWYQRYDPGIAPSLAFVTGVGEGGRTVNVAVLPPDFAAFKLLETDVRHADDPDNARLRQEEEDEFGVWRHRPNYLSVADAGRLRKLLDQFATDLDAVPAEVAGDGPDDEDDDDDD